MEIHQARSVWPKRLAVSTRAWVACGGRTQALDWAPYQRMRARMDRFVSNTVLRLDAKGRVSVPASFRSVLARDGFAGLFCYPALDQPAVDAGGHALLAEIESLIARFPPYSQQREEFRVALYGRSETVNIDGEGRAVLSEELKSHAGITDAVAFVGLGHKFQIWEPQRFRAHLAQATATVRTLTKRLGAESPLADDGARE